MTFSRVSRPPLVPPTTKPLILHKLLSGQEKTVCNINVFGGTAHIMQPHRRVDDGGARPRTRVPKKGSVAFAEYALLLYGRVLNYYYVDSLGQSIASNWLTDSADCSWFGAPYHLP